MAVVKSDAAQEVTNYINELVGFSKPLCTELRRIILNASKEIKEDWKWGPNYYCKGMVCGFSAFAKHAKLTFFNGSAMKDKQGLFNHCVDNEFNRSVKFTDISELNEKLLTAYIKESITVNKNGFKRVVVNKTVLVPDDLRAALLKNTKANRFFEGLSYGYKKEGVEWIISAKRSETRRDRVIKLIAMHSEGIRMNDKYRKQG